MSTADGALGFWAALREVYPGCEEQTCWFHKSGNVLDKIPKPMQGRVSRVIYGMWQALPRERVLEAYRHFCTAREQNYPKAVGCLRNDEASLFSFYNRPAAQFGHVRTTNPIESTYATVRRSKGCGSRSAMLTMV